MSYCRVSQDELNYDRQQSALNELFDMGMMEFKCLNCKDTFYNKDTMWTSELNDDCLCKDCYEITEVREYHLGE